MSNIKHIGQTTFSVGITVIRSALSGLHRRYLNYPAGFVPLAASIFTVRVEFKK